MQGKGDPLELERRVRGLAARQHGVVSARQLVALGLGRGAIEHRLRTGRLTRAGRGVYAFGLGPATQEARWLAAALACSDGSAISHLSGAAVWRLREVDPVTIDVTVPRRSGRRRAGIRVHRPRHLAPGDFTWHRGVPVTSVPRTLIDVAEVVSIRSLERMLDEAEFLRLLDLARLDVTLERHRGRPGSARVRSLLEHHQPGSTRTRNALEERFLLIVREAGLPQPDVNQELGSYEVDFLWRDARLVVETDGGASHDRHSQRERDGRRDAGLAIDGYRTERFTYDQVMNRPAEVTAVLETLLRAGTFKVRAGRA